MGLVIREAEPQDAGRVLAFVRAVSSESHFLTFGEGEFTLTQTQESAILKQYRNSASDVYLLGLVDEEVVAMLSFAAGRRPRVQHCGEFSMSVAKASWGQGVGGAMVDHLLDWARANARISKVSLRVRTDNKYAIRLYDRRGFLREGTHPRELLIGGSYYDMHTMAIDV